MTEKIEELELTWRFAASIIALIILGMVSAVMLSLEPIPVCLFICTVLYPAYLATIAHKAMAEGKEADAIARQVQIEEAQEKAEKAEIALLQAVQKAGEWKEKAIALQAQAKAMQAESDRIKTECEHLRNVERTLTANVQTLKTHIADATADVANAMQLKADALAKAEREKANALKALSPKLEAAEKYLIYRHSRSLQLKDDAEWKARGEEAKRWLEEHYDNSALKQSLSKE